MKIRIFQLVAAGAIVLVTALASSAPERNPLAPRVPADQIKNAKRLTTPLSTKAKSAPAKLATEGQELYEGKGVCFNCHGKSGKGDGPAGVRLDPGPRDLTNCEFHKSRDDGELFWVMKHGIAGTAMAPSVPGLLTEEEAWKIVAYMRTLCPKQ